MVIFHSYVAVYQRVTAAAEFLQLMENPWDNPWENLKNHLQPQKFLYSSSNSLVVWWNKNLQRGDPNEQKTNDPAVSDSFLWHLCFMETRFFRENWARFWPVDSLLFIFRIRSVFIRGLLNDCVWTLPYLWYLWLFNRNHHDFSWLVVWNIKNMFPYIGNNDPNWLSCFS